MGRLRIRKMGLGSDGLDRKGTSGAVMLALVGGLMIGLVGWSLQQRRHKQALFHARPFRRLAALGYLRAHPSVDSARLLREYLRWEPHPLLRRRARQVLHRMEQRLRS